MRAYGRILRGTGSYLRLAVTPFLIAILVTFLIVQLDSILACRCSRRRLFWWRHELRSGHSQQASLQLPPNCRALLRPSIFRKRRRWCGAWWRSAGHYDIQIVAAGQTVSKQVIVAPGLARFRRSD